jgi:hypothetical protein
MIRSFLALFAILSLIATGCGSGSDGKLSGAVTVDGKPLVKGTVRLEPLGGQGATAGGTVQDGYYEVSSLKPGRYRLHVEGEAVGYGGRSQEEWMKLSDKEQKALTENPLPDDAEGNDVMVEVKGGNQTQDVTLKSKKK